MSNWRQDLISNYMRQLGVADSPRTKVILVGPNDSTTWAANYIFLLVDYDYTHPSPAGSNVGTAGSVITFNLPRVCVPVLEVQISDHDVAVKDQLREWQHARQDLRIWSYAHFIAVGKLSKVPRSNSLKKQETVGFTLKGMREYTAASATNSSADSVLQLSGGHGHLLNVPFALDDSALTAFAANTQLWGSEVLL